MDDVTITPAQCRAGRALLDWTAAELAAKAGIAIATISHFERGHTKPHIGNLRHIAAALTAAGIKFVPDGVTLPPEVNHSDQEMAPLCWPYRPSACDCGRLNRACPYQMGLQWQTQQPLAALSQGGLSPRAT